MSDYVDKLKQEKKIELSRKVSLSIAEDIWEMSLLIDSPTEFIDYLMTITDQEAIEEFFNKCHDQGGKFCGGGTASRGVPGKNRGPGTHRPAPVDYFKQRIRTKLEVLRQRKISPEIRKVTVGPVLGGLTTASYGNVKIKKLAKTPLSKLSTGDLAVLKNRLEADQRFYNNFTARTAAWKSGVGIGASWAVANWKTKNIPSQIIRVDKEMKTRFKTIQDNPLNTAKNKTKVSYGVAEEEIQEFQLESLVAVVDGDFKTPPEAVLNAIAEFLVRLSEDEDVSPEDKKKILAEFK